MYEGVTSVKNRGEILCSGREKMCVCVRERERAYGYSLHRAWGCSFNEKVSKYIEVPKDRDCFGFFLTKEGGSVTVDL